MAALHLPYKPKCHCNDRPRAAQASEEAGNKWVYVKVKRKKSTYFLHIDLTETILEVKAKLQDLVQKVRPGDLSDIAAILWRTCH